MSIINNYKQFKKLNEMSQQFEEYINGKEYVEAPFMVPVLNREITFYIITYNNGNDVDEILYDVSELNLPEDTFEEMEFWLREEGGNDNICQSVGLTSPF